MEFVFPTNINRSGTIKKKIKKLQKQGVAVQVQENKVHIEKIDKDTQKFFEGQLKKYEISLRHERKNYRQSMPIMYPSQINAQFNNYAGSQANYAPNYAANRMQPYANSQNYAGSQVGQNYNGSQVGHSYAGSQVGQNYAGSQVGQNYAGSQVGNSNKMQGGLINMVKGKEVDHNRIYNDMRLSNIEKIRDDFRRDQGLLNITKVKGAVVSIPNRSPNTSPTLHKSPIQRTSLIIEDTRRIVSDEDPTSPISSGSPKKRKKHKLKNNSAIMSYYQPIELPQVQPKPKKKKKKKSKSSNQSETTVDSIIDSNLPSHVPTVQSHKGLLVQFSPEQVDPTELSESSSELIHLTSSDEDMQQTMPSPKPLEQPLKEQSTTTLDTQITHSNLSINDSSIDIPHEPSTDIPLEPSTDISHEPLEPIKHMSKSPLQDPIPQHTPKISSKSAPPHMYKVNDQWTSDLFENLSEFNVELTITDPTVHTKITTFASTPLEAPISNVDSNPVGNSVSNVSNSVSNVVDSHSVSNTVSVSNPNVVDSKAINSNTVGDSSMEADNIPLHHILSKHGLNIKMEPNLIQNAVNEAFHNVQFQSATTHNQLQPYIPLHDTNPPVKPSKLKSLLNRFSKFF